MQYRNSFRQTIIATLMILPLFAITQFGCSKTAKKDVPVAKADTAKAAPDEGRFLRFNNWAEPEYIDPGVQSGHYDQNVTRNLFEGLFNSHPKTGAPELAGATSYTVSKDLKTYTFTLNKASKWTDGKPVRAQDYAYAWTRVLNPATGSKYAFALYHIKNGQAYNTGKITDATQLGIKVIDDYTLEMQLETPAPFIISFMTLSTWAPVPEWAIKAHGSSWTRPGKLVSNGPFELVSWTTQKEIIVKKSATYWDRQNVKLAGIQFLLIEEKETALKMYMAGEIDINWLLPETKVPSLRTHPDFVQSQWFTNYGYMINVAKKPFNDVRVRQALAMAIDRDTLANEYMKGSMIPYASYVPKGIPGYTSPEGWIFNPKRAKALLAEAGYNENNPLPQFTIHYNTENRHKMIAQIVQQMWKENLGVEVALLNEEWKTYLKTQNLKNFELTRRAWVGDYLDPNTFLELYTTESTINHSNWSNLEYDALLAKAANELDATQRFAYLHQAEAILLEEVPYIPVFMERKAMLVRPDVKGFFPNLQDYRSLKSVYFDDAAANDEAKASL